jgi:hypothetical protein
MNLDAGRRLSDCFFLLAAVHSATVPWTNVSCSSRWDTWSVCAMTKTRACVKARRRYVFSRTTQLSAPKGMPKSQDEFFGEFVIPECKEEVQIVDCPGDDCAGASLCDIGNFNNGTGCAVCPAGYFKKHNLQRGCLVCSQGQYQSATAAVSCIACPAGKFSGGFSPSLSRESCQSCAPGRYAPKNRTVDCSFCASCDPQYRLDGTTIGEVRAGCGGTEEGKCKSCPRNYVKKSQVSTTKKDRATGIEYKTVEGECVLLLDMVAVHLRLQDLRKKLRDDIDPRLHLRKAVLNSFASIFPEVDTQNIR